MPLPLIIALVLLVATFILLGVALYRGSAKYAVEKRLDRIRDAETVTAEEELNRPFFQRVVLPRGEAMAKAFRGVTPAEVSERTQKKLIQAGVYPRVTAAQLLGLSWFSLILFVALMLLLLVSLGSQNQSDVRFDDPLNIAYLMVAAAAGYKFPMILLAQRVRKRQEEILLTLPYAIDVLSISVEAGMGFDTGVGYTMRKIKGPLAEEFSKTLNEIRLGKPRLDALEDLGNRTGVEELKIFITAVVHASRLGGSITNTLRVQADSIRVRRRQRAQETAMKAPVKMVIPLVFFIFPALFVVLLGPAGIRIWQQIMQ
jgi:tight adherence protein C